jgi:long-chain acyl-CoA synthetase
MTEQAETGVRCGERFTNYADLFARALRASGGLQQLGVGAGDRVALLLRNSIEFLEASIATVPLGASAVPINWHWRGEEIAHVLADSGAKVLIVHDDLWSELAPSVPENVSIVTVPADGGSPEPLPDVHSWPSWLEQAPAFAAAAEAAPVSIIYTSGTTGRPKGVVRETASESQREAGRAILNEVFALGPQERTVIPAPMYTRRPTSTRSRPRCSRWT